MSHGLVQRLMLATILFIIGAIVFALARGLSVRHTPVTSTLPASIGSQQVPTILPVVTVVGKVPIPTLATVTVHGKRLDRNVISSAVTPNSTPHSSGPDADRCSARLARCGGLEMPYYSFGKSLRTFRE